ncbi:MAG: hypothetical protein DWH97_12250 [Planctomycetota bacterium]|jgi:hypothetical protein|nr:MAG: hypothetical protein DWH97_12250 [Planctomycetota bacterium]RLS96986.1 MAG: hypothetical protein DWI12_00700 [Planctomycetota bacterium]
MSDPRSDPARDASGTFAQLHTLASARLEAARTMRLIVARESSLLATIDSAQRGEISQDDAEDLLTAHLNARQLCLSAMQADQSQWNLLAEQRSSWSDNARSTIASIGAEIAAILGELSTSDASFMSELAARRNVARIEMTRADDARAAQRAYAPREAIEPRFTDRRG